MKIGDKIRDIEDGDCYYEGVVVHIEPLRYKITNIIWSDEVDESMNGEVLGLKWWLLKWYNGSEWVFVKR